MTDVGIALPLVLGGGGELAGSEGTSRAYRLNLGPFSRDFGWRDGARSPKPRTFLELAFIASWLLALLLLFHSHLPTLDSLALLADIFRRAQAMWLVCSTGSRRECTLSRAGLLESSEKKQMGRPQAGLQRQSCVVRLLVSGLLAPRGGWETDTWGLN